MDSRVQDILDRATETQQRYIKARLVHPSPAQAAKALGLHRTTPHKWDNLDELEEAVALMLADTLEAAKAKLESLVPVALDALERAAKGRGQTSVTAARAILDRAGLPAQSQVDVTTGGEPVKVQFTWYDASTDPNAQAAQPDAEADDHL